MRFDTRKQRLLVLFVWGPLGVLMFGAGGAFVIGGEWGLTDRAVIAGLVAGAVLILPVAVLMVVRRLSGAEARAAQHAYANREEIASRWPAWTAWAIVAFSVAVGVAIDTAFGAAFMFTILTVGMIATWLAALLKRGLFQDTGGAS